LKVFAWRAFLRLSQNVFIFENFNPRNQLLTEYSDVMAVRRSRSNDTQALSPSTVPDCFDVVVMEGVGGLAINFWRVLQGNECGLDGAGLRPIDCPCRDVMLYLM